jgi:hypothetical protein
MVGWRDSDGDGILDVLDVPHSLSGSGYYDAQNGVYRFVGESSVQTLPNLNPSGLGNDITINEISRAQYRLDGGPWITAAGYDAYAADLDLAIPVAANDFQTIEIRTIDDASGVSSPVFLGAQQRPTSTGKPGINGFVWRDQDGDGIWDPSERGQPDWTVQVVDQQGQPLQLGGGVEPDDYPSDLQLLNDVNPAVTLEAVGLGVADGSVMSSQRDTSSTGSRVFAHLVWGNQVSAEWTASSRKLKMTFSAPVTTVSLDAVANSEGDYGRLEVYDAADRLLARYTTRALADGDFETMTLSRPTAEIAYAVASGHAGAAVRFDNLRFGPEATAVTDALGAYSIACLEAGPYTVQVVPQAGWDTTHPSPVAHSVNLGVGETARQIDFGVQAATVSWQNPVNPCDVNDDGVVSAIDVLILVDDLNQNGSRELPSQPGGPGPLYYIDVSGDGFLSSIDLLRVVNMLGRGGPLAPGSGEGPAGGGSAGKGEGESSGGMDAGAGAVLVAAPTAPGGGTSVADHALPRPTPPALSNWESLGSDRRSASPIPHGGQLGALCPVAFPRSYFADPLQAADHAEAAQLRADLPSRPTRVRDADEAFARWPQADEQRWQRERPGRTPGDTDPAMLRLRRVLPELAEDIAGVHGSSPDEQPQGVGDDELAPEEPSDTSDALDPAQETEQGGDEASDARST